MFLFALLIGANTVLPSTASESRSWYNAWKKVSDAVESINNQVTSSKWFQPTVVAGLSSGALYSNYVLYNDYKQFKRLSQEDKQSVANCMVAFLIRTIFIGRESYTEGEPGVDFDYNENLMPALINGYSDVIAGKTSLVIDEKHIQGFKVLGRMLFMAPMSVIATIAALKMGFDYSKKLS